MTLTEGMTLAQILRKALPGVTQADFSRIRNADLGRFTADRLMAILNRLGSRVEVKVKVRRVEPAVRCIRKIKGQSSSQSLRTGGSDSTVGRPRGLVR